MIITFMGTAASEGIPGIFCRCGDCLRARRLGGKELRSRSQILIDEQLLIDLGPETYWKSVQYGIDLSSVKYLFLTHSHTDHLDERILGFRGGWFGKEMAEPVLYAYGNGKTAERIRTWLDSRPFPFVKPATRETAIRAFDVVEAGPYRVTALPAYHSPAEECLIYLIEVGDRRVLYATDTGYLAESVYEYLKDSRLDCVIMDCTLGNNTEPGDSHMGLRENRQIRGRFLTLGIADERTRFLATHIAHGTGGYEYLAECAGADGIEVAYDGMRIEL